MSGENTAPKEIEVVHPPYKIVADGYSEYESMRFLLDGHEAIVILPKGGKQKGWIWRTEFLGAFDYADKEMLRRGYALAHYKISDMYGCDEAVMRMKTFSDRMVEMGYSDKPVLFGFSRGGLYAVRFAAAYPDRVSGLYLDAPVLDIKSWPAGFGKGCGAPVQWEECKKWYGLESDEAAKIFDNNPLDGAKLLAKAGIPVIIVTGDCDEAVPHDENTLLFEERYREEGGCIRVIIKEGGRHHPHSLEDPKEICDFVEECILGTRTGDVRMTVFADLHLRYTPGRFFAEQKSDILTPVERFDRILSEAKAFRSDLLISLGDFGLDSPALEEQLEAIDKWKRFSGNKLAIMGNHEYDVKGYEEDYKAAMGIPSNYYYFDFSPSLRFIALDSANPAKLPSEEQFLWLDKIVSTARRGCILLIHGVPWRPVDEKIRERIRRYNVAGKNPKVLMLLNGHTHMTSYKIEDGGTHYLEVNSPSFRYDPDPKYKSPVFYYSCIPFAQVILNPDGEIRVIGHGEKNAWIDDIHPDDNMTYQESIPTIHS